MSTNNVNSNFCYIDETNINPHLKCPICAKPFINPVIMKDGSRSCQTCVSDDDAQQILTPITEQLLLDILGNLRIKCLSCKQENLRRSDFQNHITSQCPQRIVHCQAADLKCSWIGQYDQLNEHMRICPFERLRPILSVLLDDVIQIKNKQTPVTQSLLELVRVNEQLNKYQNELESLKRRNIDLVSENISVKDSLQRLEQRQRQSEEIILELKQSLNKSTEETISIDRLREDIRNAHDEIKRLQQPTCKSEISDEKEQVKTVDDNQQSLTNLFQETRRQSNPVLTDKTLYQENSIEHIMTKSLDLDTSNNRTFSLSCKFTRSNSTIIGILHS